MDNSGTKDIQWRPRFGVINTNLLGYDDKLTAVYQTTPDSTWDDAYAIYGAYDFPIMGPQLRLNLFGGYNEFDITDPDLNLHCSMKKANHRLIYRSPISIRISTWLFGEWVRTYTKQQI